MVLSVTLMVLSVNHFPHGSICDPLLNLCFLAKHIRSQGFKYLFILDPQIWFSSPNISLTPDCHELPSKLEKCLTTSNPGGPNTHSCYPPLPSCHPTCFPHPCQIPRPPPHPRGECCSSFCSLPDILALCSYLPWCLGSSTNLSPDPYRDFLTNQLLFYQFLLTKPPLSNSLPYVVHLNHVIPSL